MLDSIWQLLANYGLDAYFVTKLPTHEIGQAAVNSLRKFGVEKYEDVLADMIKRDYDDSHRAIAPLKQADDAILCDTSETDLQQSIDLIISIIEGKI